MKGHLGIKLILPQKKTLSKIHLQRNMSRLNTRNACYHSFQNLLSSWLLP